MRLFEIMSPDGLDLDALKASLFQPGTVSIANASYTEGHYDLGNLETIGAGKRLRIRNRSGKYYGFQYFTEINGQPLRATITVGSHVLQPGQDFLDEA